VAYKSNVERLVLTTHYHWWLNTYWHWISHLKYRGWILTWRWTFSTLCFVW
jgi:hypothetical protein